MHWLKDYWWILLILLAGMIFNGIKALQRLDHRPYLKNRPQPPSDHNDTSGMDDKDPPGSN